MSMTFKYVPVKLVLSLHGMLDQVATKKSSDLFQLSLCILLQPSC